MTEDTNSLKRSEKNNNFIKTFLFFKNESLNKKWNHSTFDIFGNIVLNFKSSEKNIPTFIQIKLK